MERVFGDERAHALYRRIAARSLRRPASRFAEPPQRRPKFKVVFATGYARNAIMHQGRLDPSVDPITKPFTPTALAAKINHALQAEASRLR